MIHTIKSKYESEKAMKTNFIYSAIVILLFMLPFKTFSQVKGKVIYRSILESEKFQDLESILFFNDQESYFYVDMESKTSTSDKEEGLNLNSENKIQYEIDLSLKRPKRYEVYYNRQDEIILSQNSFFKNGKTSPCVVIEESGSINWNITGDTKNIGTFKVLEATTTFRGRNYTAWFAPEIPISDGPWKFHGLPGLILEVTDEELGVQFLFSSIKTPYELKNEIKKPSDGKLISLSEYVEYQNSFSEEFIKLVKAKLPRDANISNISVKETVKSIEREY